MGGETGTPTSTRRTPWELVPVVAASAVLALLWTLALVPAASRLSTGLAAGLGVFGAFTLLGVVADPRGRNAWAVCMVLVAAQSVVLSILMLPSTLVEHASVLNDSPGMCGTPCFAVPFGGFVLTLLRAFGPTWRWIGAHTVVACAIGLVIPAVGYVVGHSTPRTPTVWEQLDALVPSVTASRLEDGAEPQVVELTPDLVLLRTVEHGECLTRVRGFPIASERYWELDCGVLVAAPVGDVWLVTEARLHAAPDWAHAMAFHAGGDASLERSDLEGPVGAPMSWSWSALVLLALAVVALAIAGRRLREARRIASMLPATVEDDGVARTAAGLVRGAGALPTGPAVVDSATVGGYREGPRTAHVRPGDKRELEAQLHDQARDLGLLAFGLALAATAPLVVAEHAGLVVSMPWMG